MISVIIPTYNRKNLLKDCLQVLFTQTYPQERFEIIVADDGSTDETKNLIQKLSQTHHNLHYVYGKHRGVYAVRNLGIKKTLGEIIAFTDDDCLPKKDWLEQIDLAFKRNPKALGIEGKTLTYPEKTNLFTAYVINTQGGGYQTCNIAYKKAVLKKIGGFDTWYKFHCGDIDLALQVLKVGSIIFAPEVLVVHPPRPTKFFSLIKSTRFITSEFRLFLKFPEFFSQKYPHRNIFSQVIFVNSIWQRLFLIKHFSDWLHKKPLSYLLYVTQKLLEITAILLQIPHFWKIYQELRQEFISSSPVPKSDHRK